MRVNYFAKGRIHMMECCVLLCVQWRIECSDSNDLPASLNPTGSGEDCITFIIANLGIPMWHSSSWPFNLCCACLLWNSDSTFSCAIPVVNVALSSAGNGDFALGIDFTPPLRNRKWILAACFKLRAHTWP